MKLLVDMNLSPQWVHVLSRHGYSSRHWSEVGDPKATDQMIMEWAVNNGYAIMTHDLDFGAILASSKGAQPSVIQIRTQDVMPEAMEELLIGALKKFADILESGALIVVDKDRLRARILPLVE